MKRFLLILALCGSVQAQESYNPWTELREKMERQQAVYQQQEILLQNEKAMERLEEIERQQEEILSKQRRLERDSTDYWGRPWHQ